MTRLPGLAERLDLLLRTAPRLATDPRPHTNELVAEALSAQGVEVSAVHILNLRAGRRDNPSARLLEGRARVFGVAVTFFLSHDGEGTLPVEPRILGALQDVNMQKLMMCA